MQQEAAHEFIRTEGHDLVAGAPLRAVVLPAEGHAPFSVKGCAMPALKPHACERAGEPVGRRRTSLDGGNRGVLRCGGNLTRLWRLKRSHYQSGDGELRQTRR